MFLSFYSIVVFVIVELLLLFIDEKRACHGGVVKRKNGKKIEWRLFIFCPIIRSIYFSIEKFIYMVSHSYFSWSSSNL